MLDCNLCWLGIKVCAVHGRKLVLCADSYVCASCWGARKSARVYNRASYNRVFGFHAGFVNRTAVYSGTKTSYLAVNVKVVLIFGESGIKNSLAFVCTFKRVN